MAVCKKNPPDASCVSREQNNTVAGKRKPAKALRCNLYAAGWGNPDTAGGDSAKFCLGAEWRKANQTLTNATRNNRPAISNQKSDQAKSIGNHRATPKCPMIEIKRTLAGMAQS